MTIAGIGSNPGASQMLSWLLSRLQNASAATTGTGSTPAPASSCQNGTDSSTTSSTSLTGSTTPSLSSAVLGALIAQQSASGAATASSSDPVQNLFSAMDTDGNGSVSQSELEQYLEKQGGTQTEADNLYAMLGGANGSSASGTTGGTTGGLTEAQLAANAPTTPAASTGVGGTHGHHHHHGAHKSGTPADLADQLMDTADTSADGTATDPVLAGTDSSTASTSASPFDAVVSQLQQANGSGFYSPLSNFDIANMNTPTKPGSSLALTA